MSLDSHSAPTTPLPEDPAAPEALRRQVLRFLEDLDPEDAPEDDDNLMDFGLTSIGLMRLVAEWRAAGYEASFVAAARRPSLAGFRALLAEVRR